MSDAEIDAYIATGEPLAVAGAFTIDSLGAAFITRIEGDPHSVVGLSVSTVRSLLGDLGIPWTALWNQCFVDSYMFCAIFLCRTAKIPRSRTNRLGS